MGKNWLIILMTVIAFGYADIVHADETELKESYDIDTVENVNLVNLQSTMAVYSTNNYIKGLFDIYPNIIVSNDLPDKTYDNNTSTSTALTSTSKTYKVLFKSTVDITGFYLDASTVYDKTALDLTFYDANNNVLNKLVMVTKVTSSLYNNYNIEKVKKIEIKYNANGYVGASANRAIREIDFFIDPASLYASVSNLTVNNIKDNKFTAVWANTEDPFFVSNNIYLNDVLIKSNSVLTNYNFTDLLPDTEYKITISSIYEDGTEVFKHHTVKTLKDITPPAEVTEARIKQENSNIKIDYSLPTDQDLSHIEIYRNGSFIQNNEKNKDFIDTTPRINQTNQYALYTVDKNGNKSKGVRLNIEHISLEITNLKATAKDFTNVTLNWDNPATTNFEIATIYRKEPEKANIAVRLMRLFSNNDEDNFAPLFQTNGTMFKDMTVAANTNYEYKVTSLIDGKETDGATVNITTPKISIISPGTNINDGDYEFTWLAPTTGKVQISIGGTIYKTVSATDLKIIIPKTAMKYDFLGNPDVKLIPIDENGDLGIPSNPSLGSGDGNNTPGGIEDIKGGELVGKILNGHNLLTLSIALLTLVGSFVLLGLAFKFVPLLIKVISDAATSKKSKGNTINIKNNR